MVSTRSAARTRSGVSWRAAAAAVDRPRSSSSRRVGTSTGSPTRAANPALATRMPARRPRPARSRTSAAGERQTFPVQTTSTEAAPGWARGTAGRLAGGAGRHRLRSPPGRRGPGRAGDLDRLLVDPVAVGPLVPGDLVEDDTEHRGLHLRE